MESFDQKRDTTYSSTFDMIISDVFLIQLL